jgi:fructosamine-3-kinase
MTASFVKRDPAAPAGFFEAEARGLRWLAEAADGVPVVRVREVGATHLTLDRLTPVAPTAAAAECFGRQLARTHRIGAPGWGRGDGDGFIGPLPLPNGPFVSLADLWWEGRVRPYLAQALHHGLLDEADAQVVDALAERVPLPSAEPPSRVHGDLWSGNVVWTASGAVLVDAAAAHGGHREADLAMLALFGLPHLDRVLAAYDEQWPLAEGWRERVALWQLHPLLVHVVLFGGGYVASTRAALRAARAAAER